MIGYLALVPLLLGLIVWSMLAPLNAAAIANGEVVLTHDRKVVQHLEGGLIEEIMVREGDAIEAGDPLLAMRDIESRTKLNTLMYQLASSRARHQRLLAERDGLRTPDFETLRSGLRLSDNKIQSVKKSQLNLFRARRLSSRTKIALIEARQVSAKKEIDGLTHQLASVVERREIALEERHTLSKLYKKQLAKRNSILRVKREIAELEGEIGSVEAKIAHLEQQVLSLEVEIIDFKAEAQTDVLTELQRTELEIKALTEELVEASDEFIRTIVRSPSSGLVMNMKIHTIGAVVKPGEPILEIVPQDDRLIVEARVDPNDIDLVTKGTKAKVLLSAYNARKTPKLDGEVISVTGDVLIDEVTNRRYFIARITTDDRNLANFGENMSLYPGMRAQVFLIAGERTIADYLLSPLIDATFGAFREE